MNIGARGSKLTVHYHKEVVCPNCIRTAGNSMHFVRPAAVRTEGKKKKHAIQIVPMLSGSPARPTRANRVANVVLKKRAAVVHVRGLNMPLVWILFMDIVTITTSRIRPDVSNLNTT